MEKEKRGSFGKCLSVCRLRLDDELLGNNPLPVAGRHAKVPGCVQNKIRKNGDRAPR
jgi:hypothetical protein